MTSYAQSFISVKVAPINKMAAQVSMLLGPICLWSGHNSHSPLCPCRHVQLIFILLPCCVVVCSSMAVPHWWHVLKSSISLASSTNHLLSAELSPEPLLDVEPEHDPGLDGEVSLSGSKLSSAGSSSPNSPKLVLISCRGSSSSSCGIYRDIFRIL